MRKENSDVFDVTYLRSNLKQKSLQGGAITLVTRVISFVIQLGSLMIMARILTPRDYGLMAMVAVITGFANMMISLGLSTATIQRAEINHAQVSTLFWINTGFGAVVMLIVAGLSPVVAWFYKTPELVWVMLALSSTFLINTQTERFRI